MFKENKRTIGILYVISFAAIGVGVILGAVYYVYKFINTAEIKNYLDAYLNSLRNGMDLMVLIKTTLKSYLLLFIGVIFASFFKYGQFLTLFLLIRKGFVSAFTTSAMIDVYGLGGISLCLSSLFQILILIPTLAVFSAVSVFRSKKKTEFEKNDKIIYIIFCIVIFTIFCGCAVLEGLLNTTFMKWISFKVT